MQTSGGFRRLAVTLCVLIGGLLLATAPAGAQPMKDISAKALTDHGCDSSEWHFVITQIESEDLAPASIFVSWANGASENVPLDKVTGGTGHYATTSNLDSTVVSATAVIYAEWGGQFNLSHGPCGDPPTEVPPTEVPPTEVPPTEVPPTEVPPTEVPPTEVPPTEVPPTEVPPTEVPPTETPATTPTEVPPTETPVTTTPTVTHTSTPGLTPTAPHQITPTATSPVAGLPSTGTTPTNHPGTIALLLAGTAVGALGVAGLIRSRRTQ